MLDTPLRVLMVIQGFPPKIGGAELQVARLLPRLTARGVHATVVTRAFAGRPRRERVDGGVVVRSRVAGDGPTASLTYVATCVLHLVRRRRRIDVVHAHGALSEGVVALVARALGVPALVKVLRTGEQGDFDALSRRPLGRLRTRLLVRHVHFVAVSAETRAELQALGAPPERILDVPNGVDTGVFAPARPEERAAARRELGLPPEGVVAAYVGRLIEVKEVETALRAIAAVPDVLLLVVGEGEERPRLETLAAELGVEERCRFLGPASDVRAHLRAADAFLLPSRSEGLSNALLEAMAAGLACIASPASGSAGLLENGRGLLVPAGAVDEWAAAVRSLAGDEELRRALGAAARAYVLAERSLDATAEQLVAGYRRLRYGQRPSRRRGAHR